MIPKRREGRELRAAEKVVTYREQPGGLMRDLIANQVEYIGFDSNCAVTDVISFGKIQHFSFDGAKKYVQSFFFLWQKLIKTTQP